MKKIAFLLVLLATLPAVAGMREGLGYFDNQQYTQAFAEFKPLADQNNERAQYYVAYMYLNGYGTTRDEEKGLSYLQKSVDQGFEKALSTMGYFLSEGLHMPQNKEKAVELYMKAAEKNDDDALLNLGVLYYLGDGVEQDTKKALEYFQKVDLVNNPIVGRYIANIYQTSANPEEQAKVKPLYKQAAANGDLESFRSLAYLYQTGPEAERNIEEAVKYYTYAASQSLATAQYALGTLYANGQGVERNIFTAYAWLSLAANQNLPVAIQAQKQLEENMTLSDLERGRREMIEIQRNVIGKVESPLKDYLASNSANQANSGKPEGRRSRSRRRR